MMNDLDEIFLSLVCIFEVKPLSLVYIFEL